MFLHAYKYGIIIRCHDGIERRVYPCIFTYSADYPEKVLLATIQDKGLCPCPRCLIPKSQVDRMGLVHNIQGHVTEAQKYLEIQVNIAHDYIYKKGMSIGSSAVDDVLKSTSSVPTINAFINCLGSDFPLSDMLVVDFMHEFELGIWKALFVHLIRVLYTMSPDGSLVNELDQRYPQIPTFGISTIRCFTNNTSKMKRLAARDFEDILQCTIPPCEGLLKEPHNMHLMKLLFWTAEWHAYAKLRMHTESTLKDLAALTKEFGQLMRQFRNLTCDHFETFELPHEAHAHIQRTTKKGTSTNTATLAASAVNNTVSAGLKKLKKLNLFTYKFHAMGDYVQTIRMFGCTDSYLTQSKFLPKLQDHILGRLLQRTFDGDMHEDYTDNDRNTVRILGNKIFSVQTCHINYTTYDVRQEDCCINPRSHADIMVKSPEGDSSPYWYARVIGIFHATIICTHPEVIDQLPLHLDFLTLLPVAKAAVRVDASEVDDWVNFYVEIFVDQDMFMRHHRGGVGHKGNLPASTSGDNGNTDKQEPIEPVDSEGQVGQEVDDNRDLAGSDTSDEEDSESDDDSDDPGYGSM
ncbi:hypothetical protein H0H92_002838 [Tricholoma furcatifolium]|nr:hypothetical protein H0H92_002838 [Tricholoma furcatifolium]